MLRQAVRTVLADAGGRPPSHEAWGLLLMAAGVEANKAAGLPARLGYVFHIGHWTETDVVLQLEAWGDALRVRAEPDVAAVVDSAAASLREQVAAEPEPPEPVRPASPPVGPSASATPPHVAAPRPPAPQPPQRRRETREQAKQQTKQQAKQQGRAPQGGAPQGGVPQAPPPPGQASPWTVPPPPTGGSRVPTSRPGGGPSSAQRQRGTVVPRGTKPRANRLVPIIGILFVVLLCGCSLIGLVAEMFSGNG